MINKIIESAIIAPSGENCQPWRFEIAGQKILLFNCPERDQSAYNWEQRASLVSHGAAIENMAITAHQLGQTLDIKLFPDSNQPNLVATLEVRLAGDSARSSDSLYPFLEKRCTNRKPYAVSASLPPEEKQDLEAGSSESVTITILDDKTKIGEIAMAASVGEKVLFENRRLHDFFFGHVSWTKQEDEEKRTGFFIETLELPLPAKVGFKLFKHWSALNIANKIIGASKVVAKENAKNYTASSGFGAVSVNSKRPEDFIAVGRVLERAWLTATKLGLSFQPVTGVIWFQRRLENGEGDWFSENHKNLIGEAYRKIFSAFGLQNSQTLAMMFRVGRSTPPSARSLRFPFDKFVK